MKHFLILIIFSFVFNSCASDDGENKLPNTDLNLIRTEKGFDVYSLDGELLLEFTYNNCDTNSLNTLLYIYEVVNEYNNGQYIDTNNKNINTISFNNHSHLNNR